MAGQVRSVTPHAPVIGSVLPLPDVGDDKARADSLWSVWTGGRSSVSAYRSARAALAALLSFRAIARVWLPAYACPALAQGAASSERLWYGVDSSLASDIPSLSEDLREGDAVVGVDYFGRAPDTRFLDLVAGRPDVLWIEDRAHAIDTGQTAWGDVLLYSPRKLIGVGDGGLLISDEALPTPTGPPSPNAAPAQVARAADPDGLHPERWFPAFRAQEAAFAIDDAAMSDLSRRVLECVPLEPLAAARRANGHVLARELADLALWPDTPTRFAPLAYPVRLHDRDLIAAAMAAEGIFCPRHWSDLPSEAAAFPVAHHLSREMLLLPCDHRYNTADMERVVETLRRLQARGAR